MLNEISDTFLEQSRVLLLVQPILPCPVLASRVVMMITGRRNTAVVNSFDILVILFSLRMYTGTRSSLGTGELQALEETLERTRESALMAFKAQARPLCGSPHVADNTSRLLQLNHTLTTILIRSLETYILGHFGIDPALVSKLISRVEPPPAPWLNSQTLGSVAEDCQNVAAQRAVVYEDGPSPPLDTTGTTISELAYLRFHFEYVRMFHV